MLRYEKVVCEKCGKSFWKVTGGFVSNKIESFLCNKCKIENIRKLFN